jgi:hypothetical protein
MDNLNLEKLGYAKSLAELSTKQRGKHLRVAPLWIS